MKNNKTTLYILLISAAAVAIGVWAVFAESSGSPASGDGGNLQVSETRWDLGKVSMKDGLSVKEITLENTGSDPVTVNQITTSCMCTEVTFIRPDGSEGPTKGMPGHGGTPYLSEAIAPGESATLSVVFDPNAHGPNAVGPISRTVTIGTDDPQDSTITLRFTGVVTK